MDVAPKRYHLKRQTKSWPCMLVASKDAVLKNYLMVSTWIRLNATRRSISLSVYLVFDLEAGRFKFLCENLLGARGVHFPS